MLLYKNLKRHYRYVLLYIYLLVKQLYVLLLLFVALLHDEILSFSWTDVIDNDIIKYNVSTKEDLSRIRILLEANYCSEMSCSTHQTEINNFYYDIVY